MSPKALLIFTILLVFTLGCNIGSSKKDLGSKGIDLIGFVKSRVTFFNYLGYGDTIFAMLEGTVIQIDKSKNSKDSIRPLPRVSICAEQNGKTVFTDVDERFSIGLSQGIFSFIISSEGYQPIKVINWKSDPDQVSQIEIALEKGTELQSFKVPKWTK